VKDSLVPSLSRQKQLFSVHVSYAYQNPPNRYSFCLLTHRRVGVSSLKVTAWIRCFPPTGEGQNGLRLAPERGAGHRALARCKKLVSADKQMTLHRTPNCLVVHLKRFQNASGGKIQTHIRFDEQLDLTQHLSGGSVERHATYRLYGVLVHVGFSASSGHYYCFAKVPPPRHPNRVWEQPSTRRGCLYEREVS